VRHRSLSRILRARGEIVGLPNYGHVGKSQCVLIMKWPVISSRTRTCCQQLPRRATPSCVGLRGAACIICDEWDASRTGNVAHVHRSWR
jgi:hypothetical protein